MISTHNGLEPTKSPFIPYDPHEVRKGKDSFSKACISCYMRHRTVSSLSVRLLLGSTAEMCTKCKPGSDVITCQACLGRSGYCKGPIQTPSLFNYGRNVMRSIYFVAKLSARCLVQTEDGILGPLISTSRLSAVHADLPCQLPCSI